MLIIPNLVMESVVPDLPVDETTVAQVAQQINVVDLVLQATIVVQGVLLLLFVMSVVTWGIVLVKWWQLKVAKAQSMKFAEIFYGTRNLTEINKFSQALKSSPVASVFEAGHRELSQVLRAMTQRREQGFREVADAGDIESIERTLRRAKAEEVTRLESGTTFLATTASAAPFIGLFGTVWGIMHAFMGLHSAKSTSIQAVAPGISEALIATAIGLAAAIPAAIAFNYFMQQVRVMARDMDIFSAEFLNIAKRHFLK